MDTELPRKQIGQEMFDPPDLKGGGAITLDDRLKVYSEHMATEPVILNKSKRYYRGEDGMQVNEWLTMGNVRQLDPVLTIDTRPKPVRRRAVRQPPVQPELTEKNLPSRPPVQEDHVVEAPAAVHGGVPDVRVEEVQDTQEVHHQVDAWQDGRAVDVHDDDPTGGRDDQDQGRLVEDVTKDAEPNGSSARDHPSLNPSTVLMIVT